MSPNELLELFQYFISRPHDTTRRRSENAYGARLGERDGFGDGDVLGTDIGCMREMADAL